MKIRFITKWLAIIIVIISMSVCCLFVHGYIKKHSNLEKGIVINKLDEKDTAVLCSYFNIVKNEDIKINYLEYEKGFKDVYVKLYVKANCGGTNDILKNYVDINVNFYLDSMNFSVADNYSEYKPLVNAKNLKKYAFVFYYKKDVIIVFYSNTSDNSITNLVDKKISEEDYVVMLD